MKELKFEFKRSVMGNSFKIAIIIGVTIAIIQFIVNGLLTGEYLEFLKENNVTTVGAGINNIHNRWLGGELNSFYSSIFWEIFPFLAAIPFASAYYIDRKFGRIKNVLTRTNPKKYYISIWCANFFVSGLSCIIPLIFNLLLHLTTSTWMKPFIETSTFEVGYQSSKLIFYLFYNKPSIYLLIYLVNIFVFAGLISNVGLASVILEDKFYTPLFVPFIIWLFTDLMSLLYPKIFISFKGYLNPVGGNITLTKSLILIIVLFLLSAVPLWYQYNYKKDF